MLHPGLCVCFVSWVGRSAEGHSRSFAQVCTLRNQNLSDHASPQVDLRANVLRFTNLDIALPFLQGSDLPPAARMLAEEGAIPFAVPVVCDNLYAGSEARRPHHHRSYQSVPYDAKAMAQTPDRGCICAGASPSAARSAAGAGSGFSEQSAAAQAGAAAAARATAAAQGGASTSISSGGGAASSPAAAVPQPSPAGGPVSQPQQPAPSGASNAFSAIQQQMT